MTVTADDDGDDDDARQLAEGKALRDEGIARVLAAAAQAEWKDDAFVWIITRHRGDRITSTDLVNDVGIPPSPRAVGALIRTAALRGYLTPTDDFVPSTRAKRHAGIVRVWVVT